MDYDNPQFIAAVKKIFWNLAGKADKDVSTESEQAQAPVEKDLALPVTNVLNIPDSAIERIKAPTAHEKRREWWMDFVEVAAFGILALYTLFSYFQWKELKMDRLGARSGRFLVTKRFMTHTTDGMYCHAPIKSLRIH